MAQLPSDGRRLRPQAEPVFQVQSKRRRKGDVPLRRSDQKSSAYRLWGVSTFVPVGPSTDWTKPTTLGRAICFSPTPASNVTLIPQTATQTHSESCWTKSLGSPWPP